MPEEATNDSLNLKNPPEGKLSLKDLENKTKDWLKDDWTAHGFSHIFRTKRLFIKIMWFLIVISFTAFCLWCKSLCLKNLAQH